MESEDEDDLLTPVAALLRGINISHSVVKAVLDVAMNFPIWVAVRASERGEATANTEIMSYYYRAAFIVESSKRVARAYRDGAALNAVISMEKQFYLQHLEAVSNRRAQAMAIDKLAKRLDTMVLGWYSIRDGRTSKECREAHGKNFDVGSIPVIGYPGTVHPKCRCYAGPPHAVNTMLPALVA